MEGTSLGGELVLVSTCLTVSPLITGGQAHTHTHTHTHSSPHLPNNDLDGWQAPSVRAAAGSGCGLHATACSGAARVRQRAAAASKWEQPAARLQLKTVMAAGGGGGAKSIG